MDTSTRKAFKVSLVLHGAGLLLLVLSVFWSQLFSEPQPDHVFELVAISEPAMEEAPPPQAQPRPNPDPAPKMTLPKLPELDQRDVKIPEPQPEPEPTPQPQPKPEPTPKPAPQKKPEPEVKPLNYADFQKTNKLPTNTPKPRTQPRTITAPKIDVSDIQRDLQQNLSRSDSARVSQMSAAQQSQLFDYFQRVRSMLDAAFIRPEGLPYKNYEALVQFTIERDGRISDVTLVRSSGNTGFDNAVLAAFRRTRLPPTPDQQRYVRKIPFQILER